MMDIRRAAALLLALVMIAALTVGCGKKQSDTPTDTPAAGADGRTPAQQPAKLVCYNGSVTLRFVREEDTWYWGDDRDFPLEQSIVTELLAQAKLKKGDVFVVGCSSSEIVGGHIGKDSSLEAAQAVYAGVAPVLAENGIWLAAQCCEHLNRAIIIEREAAEKYGWEEVCVVPRPHAGGSWATTCWKQFKDPIAVEEIRAHAGIDIGGTLIGMHLRRVAVPVRLSLSKIGEANILCARTRPKLIGGERAKYTEED
jgi:uncharacterized protein (TIGR01440 family)